MSLNLRLKRYFLNADGFVGYLLFVPFIVSIIGKLIREDRTAFSLWDHTVLLLPEIFLYVVLWALLTGLISFFKTLKSSIGQHVLISLAFLVVCNFTIVEAIGHMYKSTTGDGDFDYSLIFHSANNIVELWQVFAAEFGRTTLWMFVCVAFIVLGLMFWGTIKAFHAPINLKFWRIKGSTVVAVGAVYALTNIYHQFPVKPTWDRPALDSNPVPVSQAALVRTINKFIDGLVSGPVNMLRTEYPVAATLKYEGAAKLPNVVLVVLESSGRDKTVDPKSEYPKTPFLKKVADEGLEYTKAYSFVPHTSKSLTSIICGIEPSLNLQNLAGKLSTGILSRCLPSLLEDIGYTTHYFSPVVGTFEYRAQFVQNAGYDDLTIYDQIKDKEKYHQVSGFGLEENSLIPSVEAYLSRTEETPFFLTFLTLSPHHPYEPVPSEPLVTFSGQKPLDGHLTALQYQDKFLKKLFGSFEQAGKLDDTIFIFVGDHGEAFGKHGVKQHDTVMYDEVLNVPFIVWGKNIPTQKDATPVSLLDVLPTVVELISAEIKDGAQGYAGKAASQRTATDSIYSYCFREKYCASHSKGDWKLIHYFGNKPDLLFNRKTDPDEQINLLFSEAERAEEMKKQLTEYFQFVGAYQRNYYQNGNNWVSP